MPSLFPTKRVIKSKMELHGVLQKDLYPLFRDSRDNQRSDSYLKARMAGKRDWTTAEALILKRELKITNKDDFLETFFPGEKWDAS